MPRTLERYQNPTCGDTVNLRLFTYNSNNRQNVQSIEKVEIYTYDNSFKSADNPQGRRLVTTVDSSDVVQEDTGQYLLQLPLTNPLYTIGFYQDVWHVTFEEDIFSSLFKSLVYNSYTANL